MKTINRLKNYFFDKDYFISFYPDHVYVINYVKIIDFSNSKILFSFNSFNLLVKGSLFKIIRKNFSEVEVFGKFNSMEILNGEE